MSEHADFINGLHVVECELERVIGELDEMQDRRGIPTHDRVSLDPLQWALNKLADDLHDATVEIRRARLEVVSARRGAEDAREVRDAASQLHLLECRKYNAEFERRLALEKQVTELTAERDSLKQQVAELTEKLGELPDETAPESYDWQVGDEVERDDGTIHTISQAIGGLLWVKDQTIGMSEQWWLAENGYQLHRKASDIPQPPEPAPEPYPWQVGDIIESNAFTRRRVEEMHCGGVLLEGMGAPLPQPEWERRGFKLHRKAADLPDIAPLTPQQVAEFAAVAEPIDDSTGADGEGQS